MMMITQNDSLYEATRMNVLYTEEDMDAAAEECRICLEVGSAQNQLIVPCKCIGSVKHVHKECIREWVSRQYSQKQQRVSCEMCKVPFHYTILQKKQCNPGELIKKRINKDLKSFIFILLLILISLVVDIYLTMIMFEIIFNHPKAIQIGVVSFSILIVTVIIIILINIIVFKFFVSQKNIVGEIMAIQQVRKKLKNNKMVNSSTENIANYSKARIHPVHISDID